MSGNTEGITISRKRLTSIDYALMQRAEDASKALTPMLNHKAHRPPPRLSPRPPPQLQALQESMAGAARPLAESIANV